MGEAGYKSLIVWQKANKLAYSVYLKTNNFPKEEKYALRSQLMGSLAETEYLLEFSKQLGYFKKYDYQGLQDLRQEVGNLLWKFYQSI